MRTGVHKNEMANALASADMAYVLNPPEFSLNDVATDWHCPYQVLPSTDAIVEAVAEKVQVGTQYW